MIFIRSFYLNLNLAYKVTKCYHGKNDYIYIYELPLKNWAVVTYEEDDDTVKDAVFFFEWKDALNYYNKEKRNV